jgi:hypothetical protein
MAADPLREVLKSQYHAALAMLRDAVDRCPEDTWYDTGPRNAFWQIAYHTLFFTHLYLQPTEHAFVPWRGHQSSNQNPDGIAGEPDPKSRMPLIPEPYTRRQVLEYWADCDDRVDRWVDALDLAAPDSGFSWYSMSKLEHQFVNLRHVQHHAAQLADRLRQANGVGVRWVAAGRR